MPKYITLPEDEDTEIIELDRADLRYRGRRRPVDTEIIFTDLERVSSQWTTRFATRIVQRYESMPLLAQTSMIVGIVILFSMIGFILLIINTLRSRTSTNVRDSPINSAHSGDAPNKWDSQTGF